MELQKSSSSTIGLRIAGGRNKKSSNGFLYIQSINEESIAAKNGKMKEKDLLLEVSDVMIAEKKTSSFSV